MIDASFERISKVSPHPNADRLEVADVGGFTVVCGKGDVKAGDVVFYVRDDACLLDHSATDAEAFRYPWQAPFVKYLGGGGRVKTVRLRGVFSSGFVVPVENVYAHIEQPSARDWEADNARIRGEGGDSFLRGKFGVEHYVTPLKNLGNFDALSDHLPFGLWKTDEENFQSIDDSSFPWGEKVLVTRKIDGSSETITASPDGTVHVTSRSMDLKTDSDNNFTRAAAPVIPLLVAYAKKTGHTIVARGEMTSQTTNRHKANIDAVGAPRFRMFATVFPEEPAYSMKIGMYGTENHFLKVNERIRELTGCSIETVPILGEEILTHELLRRYADAPRSEGEGVVVNTSSESLPHFKAKSMDYITSIG